MSGFDENLNMTSAASSLAASASSCRHVPETPLRHVRAWIALALLVIVALFPSLSHATCTVDKTVSVTFSPPATINVPYNTAAGTVLWSSNAITPPVNTLTCTGSSTQYGLYNNVGGQTPTSTYIFPTGIPGVGYEIAHNTATSYVGAYGCCTIASGTYTSGQPSYLYLVATGTITNDSVLNSATLGYYRFANSTNAQSFVLGNNVQFIVTGTCSVVTTPITVTLPTVALSTLKATGAVSGDTPFNIALNCHSGSTLAITLNYNGANTGITGVLANTGTATGVGVQMLNSDNATPVSFGTTTTLGATPNGTYNLPYYGQYYRTGTATAGSVTASATFTLSYQ